MDEIEHTVTISYTLDKTAFPGGMTETDISVEQDMLREAVEWALMHKMGLKAAEMDVSVESSKMI